MGHCNDTQHHCQLCNNAPHTHFGGEEIFVLEGTFIDEKGEYPTGTWIRSPHLSSHNPFVKEGCTILVKVGHMITSNNKLGQYQAEPNRFVH